MVCLFMTVQEFKSTKPKTRDAAANLNIHETEGKSVEGKSVEGKSVEGKRKKVGFGSFQSVRRSRYEKFFFIALVVTSYTVGCCYRLTDNATIDSLFLFFLIFGFFDLVKYSLDSSRPINIWP